jgi:hypothetical protein
MMLPSLFTSWLIKIVPCYTRRARFANFFPIPLNITPGLLFPWALINSLSVFGGGGTNTALAVALSNSQHRIAGIAGLRYRPSTVSSLSWHRCTTYGGVAVIQKKMWLPW